VTWVDVDGIMHRRQAALERDALGWRVLELLREFGMTPRSRCELVAAGRLDPKWMPGRYRHAHSTMHEPSAEG